MSQNDQMPGSTMDDKTINNYGIYVCTVYTYGLYVCENTHTDTFKWDVDNILVG